MLKFSGYSCSSQVSWLDNQFRPWFTDPAPDDHHLLVTTSLGVRDRHCLALSERMISITLNSAMQLTGHTETNMVARATAKCVQKSDDSRFCNSHCVSHFAAFFIVIGAKISIVENLWIFWKFINVWMTWIGWNCWAEAPQCTQIQERHLIRNDPSAGSPTEL